MARGKKFSNPNLKYHNVAVTLPPMVEGVVRSHVRTSKQALWSVLRQIIVSGLEVGTLPPMPPPMTSGRPGERPKPLLIPVTAETLASLDSLSERTGIAKAHLCAAWIIAWVKQPV